jgi:hypothetical protein
MDTPFSPLPNAHFFWKRLADYLASVGGEFGLDAACGAFVNRHLFQTRLYCGLDLSQRRLQTGLARYPHDTACFGVVAPLGRPLPFRACADICVSSSTLVYVPPAHRLEVTQQLVDTVRRGGRLVVQMRRFRGYEALVALLRQQFRRLRVTHYHSRLSQRYNRMRWRARSGERREGTEATSAVALPYPRLTPLWTLLCERCIPNVPLGQC